MNNTLTAQQLLSRNVLVEKEVPGNDASVEVIFRVPGVDVTIPFPSPNQPGVYFNMDALGKMADGGIFTLIVRKDGARLHEAQFRVKPGAQWTVDVTTPFGGALIATLMITNAEPGAFSPDGKNIDPERCDCGKGDWCPLWTSGKPAAAAKAARDARVARELRRR